MRHITRLRPPTVARLREERGLTTAEYAIGTVAAAGLGGLLIKLVTSDEARNLIWSLLSKALTIVLG